MAVRYEKETREEFIAWFKEHEPEVFDFVMGWVDRPDEEDPVIEDDLVHPVETQAWKISDLLDLASGFDLDGMPSPDLQFGQRGLKYGKPA